MIKKKKPAGIIMTVMAMSLILGACGQKQQDTGTSGEELQTEADDIDASESSGDGAVSVKEGSVSADEREDSSPETETETEKAMGRVILEVGIDDAMTIGSESAKIILEDTGTGETYHLTCDYGADAYTVETELPAGEYVLLMAYPDTVDLLDTDAEMYPETLHVTEAGAAGTVSIGYAGTNVTYNTCRFTVNSGVFDGIVHVSFYDDTDFTYMGLVDGDDPHYSELQDLNTVTHAVSDGGYVTASLPSGCFSITNVNAYTSGGEPLNVLYPGEDFEVSSGEETEGEIRVFPEGELTGEEIRQYETDGFILKTASDMPEYSEMETGEIRLTLDDEYNNRMVSEGDISDEKNAAYLNQKAVEEFDAEGETEDTVNDREEVADDPAADEQAQDEPGMRKWNVLFGGLAGAAVLCVCVVRKRRK